MYFVIKTSRLVATSACRFSHRQLVYVPIQLYVSNQAIDASIKDRPGWHGAPSPAPSFSAVLPPNSSLSVMSRRQSSRASNPPSRSDAVAQHSNGGSRSRSRQRSGSTSDSQMVVARSRSRSSRPLSSTRSTTGVAVSPPSEHLTPLQEEETIFIDESALSGDDDDSIDEPVRRRSHRPRVDDDEAVHLDPTTDLLYNADDQEKIPSTADIRHFFARSSEGTVCNDCK